MAVEAPLAAPGCVLVASRKALLLVASRKAAARRLAQRCCASAPASLPGIHRWHLLVAPASEPGL
jgi:hypothetical protein